MFETSTFEEHSAIQLNQCERYGASVQVAAPNSKKPVFDDLFQFLKKKRNFRQT